MSIVLGIDTSNYTTSFAVFDTEQMKAFQSKKLLPVKSGECGLRQSNAVFFHTKQLPDVIAELSDKCRNPAAIGASTRPRPVEGSYMPCFLVGETAAKAMSASAGCRIFTTSHQHGHILSALYSSGGLPLIRNRQDFLAFHVSGGTTDLLLCTASDKEIIDIQDIGHSLDLKAGQLIDRVGVKLGLDFPCGKELEKLAVNSSTEYKIKPVIKDGNCCLSGIENQCEKLIGSGASAEDVAKFCLDSMYAAVEAMTEHALTKHGSIPVVFAGGVMSDKLIADRLFDKFGGYFASPEYSCDNAVGTAIYAAIKMELI